ncbi:DNA cytosine methyltransferase [bacterium]|nr:DNA cytosine methyltransferase [bacterium]
MKILVGCEFSQIVTKAFRDAGHEAYSCDVLLTEGNEDWHIQDDVLNHLDDKYDLAIFHPPCTYLARSGARWWKDRQQEQIEAIKFFITLANAPINRICIENPVGIMSTVYRKPDQYIQPWQFGCGETKKTGLWLKNLPLLRPSNIVSGRKPRVHYEPPGINRQKNRSRTNLGIAKAMSEQWNF